MGEKAPALSVILVTDTYETIRPVLERLRAQPVRDQIEILLLTPARGAVEPTMADTADFAALRVLEIDSIQSHAAARAVGVREARAKIVFIGETHTYAHEGWAETLIEAHREWDVVVPAFGNANPASALSWAGFLSDYGSWGEGREPGRVGSWPGFNTSYRRSTLLEFGDQLELALQAGDAIRTGVLERGGRVRFEPTVRIDHLNVDRLGPWIDERYLCGLLMAADRATGWSWLRRIAYAFASPLIASLLLWRTSGAVLRALRQARLPAGSIPAWVLGTLVRTAGEAIGYAVGAGDAPRSRMNDYELHKVEYARSST